MMTDGQSEAQALIQSTKRQLDRQVQQDLDRKAQVRMMRQIDTLTRQLKRIEEAVQELDVRMRKQEKESGDDYTGGSFHV